MKDLRIKKYMIDDKNRLSIFFNHKSKDIQIPRNIELILRENGSIGYYKDEDVWVRGHFTGITDKLGDFVEYVGTDLSSTPKSYNLKNHDQVIVLRNNPLATSDLDNMLWDAQMRSENDISMYYQLINSRNIPVLVANNDKIKRQIERVFENIKAGVPCVITTDLLSEIEVKDIIDHDAISKMECLNELNDVLTKRSLNYYGATLDMKDKKAQVTEMELQSFEDYTTIGYLANYMERKRFVEEMNENGIDYEIIRNPIFDDEPNDEEIENGEREEKDNEIEVERDLQDQENNERSNDDE